MRTLVHPPKLSVGDKVAVLSPSFAAPGFAPAIHEQAMCRLSEATGLVPVEYPTTRKLGASPEERAADFNAALADPEIRAVLSSIGGEDQIRLIRHLDVDLLRADPKPFLGYSDNTNILNWFWTNGVAGFYGGSTQVQIGPGPAVDEVHLGSLRAALFTGETIELTDPGESEDFGYDWLDPRALTDSGEREPTEPWQWAGPERKVTGPTWGGCIEVIDWIAMADRMPSNDDLDGSILLLETSEEMPRHSDVGWWVRSLGERGVLERLQGVVVARPPASTLGHERPSPQQRQEWRKAQREAVIDETSRYNPDAVICVGPPFGHTRPQWIVPYGGEITLDGESQKVFADYR